MSIRRTEAFSYRRKSAVARTINADFAVGAQVSNLADRHSLNPYSQSIRNVPPVICLSTGRTLRSGRS